MKHLIESPSLIWYDDQDDLLGTATIWEVAIKVASLSMPFAEKMDRLTVSEGRRRGLRAGPGTLARVEVAGAEDCRGHHRRWPRPNTG